MPNFNIACLAPSSHRLPACPRREQEQGQKNERNSDGQ